MIAKGNQPQLEADIIRLFQRVPFHAPSAPSAAALLLPVQVGVVGEGRNCTWPLSRDSTVNIGHGRIERRTLSLLEVPPEQSWPQWPGRAQVFRLQREVTHKKDGRRTEEIVYGITSLSREQADASRVQTVLRDHWAIENKLHWRRDVLWGEDQCRVRTQNAPQVLAAVRNLCISLLYRDHVQNLAAGLRRCAFQPARLIQLLST